MAHGFVFLISCVLVLLSTSPSIAQKPPPSPPPLTPSPAPAPAPTSPYVNLTHLLSFAGPFHTFLNHLIQTEVIDTLQNQANNTDQGITIFAPSDDAFSALKKPSLSNLTKNQLKSLLLFHTLPHYYSLAEFKNLSMSNPVSTFAGSQYTLNFSDVSGVVRINSGWSNPKIASSVFSTDPVAVYQVNSVLLPVAIFGTAPAPAPAPPPAPETTAPTDSAPSGGTAADSPVSAEPSAHTSSASITISFSALCYMMISMIFGGLVLLL